MTTNRMGGRADADRQNNLEITSKASCGLASRSVSVAKAMLKAPNKASSPRAACVPVAIFSYFISRRSVDGVFAPRRRRSFVAASTAPCSRCKPMHA